MIKQTNIFILSNMNETDLNEKIDIAKINWEKIANKDV